MAKRNGQNGGSGGGLWQRLWMNPALGWGCEIAPAGVSVMRWDGARGPAPARWRPLTEGAVEASPLRENLLRPEEVRQALAGCMEALGRPNGAAERPADMALVIPDPAARVFFLTFDSLPRRPAQALPLIRWKLKKSVPFDIETSTVSYVAQRTAEEWQVLAVVSPEVIIRQYEELAASLGLRARFVTLSTLGTLGLVTGSQDAAGASESVLLAKYSPPSLTITILHQGSVCLFRTIAITEAAAESGARPEAWTNILEAVHPSVAYFQDNFGAPLRQAYLCGLGENSAAIAESLSKELGLAARPLLESSETSPGGWSDGRQDGWDTAQAERHLAALLGVARERRRA